MSLFSQPTRRPRAFTLFELLVTISIIAVVASLVAPLALDDAQLRVNAAARIITSDIEFAQVHSISRPNDPLLLHFNNKKANYWVGSPANANRPIDRPDTGEPYVIDLGVGRAQSAAGVRITVSGMTENMLRFDERGALMDIADQPVITLTSGSASVELVVSPSTGTVREQ